MRLYSIYIYFLIGIRLVLATDNDFCDSETKCTEKKNYMKDDNELIRNIQLAEEKYLPCNQKNCSCNKHTMESDLLPFSNGITKQMFESVRDRGTKFQIIAHKLYRDKECMFPARCSGIEYFLKQFLNELPDMEMIINCRDWPQINKNWGVSKGPVFSFSKTHEYLDIMYPTWGFWQGGPAISLYPTGLGRWDKHRILLKKASEKWSWNEKKNKAFFRGSRTSSERDSLILLSRQNHNVADAEYTKNQAWKSPEDTLHAEPAKEVSLDDHCEYKYLFNYRGVAASFRLKHLFLCKSLVFHVGNEWNEFFYESLLPWIHYVPIQSSATIKELELIIAFFQRHDKIAEKIANEGFEHISKHLRMKDINCYWKMLLINYAKLIKYKVFLDIDLIEIT